MAVIRDFSDEAKDEIFRLIDQGSSEDENWWSPLVQDIAIAAAQAGINMGMLYDNEETIATCRKSLLDAKQAGKDEINQIWNDVYNCETEHKQSLTALREEIRQLTSEYARMAEIMDFNRPAGCLWTGPTQDLIEFFHANFDTEYEYDHYTQEKIEALKFDERFSQERWDGLDENGKEQFLQEYYDEVLRIMGIQGDQNLRFEQIGDANAQCTGNPRTRAWWVTIDTDYLKNTSREDFMTTIVEEARHGYQNEVLADYDYRVIINDYRAQNGNVPVPMPDGITYPSGNNGPLRHPFTGDETAGQWRYDTGVADPIADHVGYVSAPREYDAWAFAGRFKDQKTFERSFYNAHDLTNVITKTKLEDLHPSYRGSWE